MTDIKKDGSFDLEGHVTIDEMEHFQSELMKDVENLRDHPNQIVTQIAARYLEIYHMTESEQEELEEEYDRLNDKIMDILNNPKKYLEKHVN